MRGGLDEPPHLHLNFPDNSEYFNISENRLKSVENQISFKLFDK